MIPRRTPSWEQVLSEAFTDVPTLLQYLGLEQAGRGVVTAANGFGLLSPRRFVEQIEKGSPEDPLLRQILPQSQEHEVSVGFSPDPLLESQAEVAPGVLQKYPGRVLLMASSRCAIHCRYCFRRHAEHQSVAAEQQQLQQAIAHIRADPTIYEVILSGGDPLMLDDMALSRLICELESISHLKRVRIHSRIPLVLPERITDDLVGLLARSRFRVVLVVHCNHPNELSSNTDLALAPLKQCGITLLNQSVLLRGVNDRLETLCTLSERLFLAGVLPYYLHQLDRVAGSAHFEVSDSEAALLYHQLQGSLPGYLVPKLVREVPQKQSKEPLMPLDR